MVIQVRRIPLPLGEFLGYAFAFAPNVPQADLASLETGADRGLKRLNRQHGVDISSSQLFDSQNFLTRPGLLSSLLQSFAQFVRYNYHIFNYTPIPIQTNMYFHRSILITALAGLAAAGPVEVRQLGLGGTGSTSKEFSQGGCRDILFAWTRGSTEIGNMVRTFLECIEQPNTDLDRALSLVRQPQLG